MSVRILQGDCRDVLATLPDESVHCCVTSPPYWGLRDYGCAGQIGLESTYQQFVAEMVGVFREVRRVLRSDGTLWLNLGDSYASTPSGAMRSSGLQGGKATQQAFRLATAAKNVPDGLKSKDLCGIPWRVAFALQEDGWYLRQDIIWSKPNPMPESVTDRCTKAHEYLFLLSKSARYFYDANAIKERVGEETRRNTEYRGESTPYKNQRSHDNSAPVPTVAPRGAPSLEGRNKRSVWEVATAPFSDAHFATFPPALIEPCIKAGCPAGGTVLDPFGGAGTTGLVADRLQRHAILIELNPEYAEMARRRIDGDAPLFAEALS